MGLGGDFYFTSVRFGHAVCCGAVATLRPYQVEAIEALRSKYREGKKAPLLVLPTGAGKTYTFAFMTKSAAERGRKVLIVVHRAELLDQASRSLKALGVDHGLIAPKHYGESDSVAVGSILTILKRVMFKPMHFDFIIFDEGHHATASTWKRLLVHFPKAHVLGVTATPIRLDGKGLGLSSDGIYDSLVVGPSVGELIQMGHLVKPVVFAPPSDLDLTGLRTRFGDYSQKQLAERTDKPSITGCAVEHYQKLAPGEPAIVFCASIEHAQHVSESFNQAGFSSSVIHGKLTDHERRHQVEGLSSGRIKVLTSVDIVSEGFDLPICSVAVLLRKTQSLGLYMQQVGRVLRPAPGKTRALILDHVGNSLIHGLVQDNREWSLEGVSKRKRSLNDDEDSISIRQCKNCFAVFEQALKCPECGFIPPPKQRKVEQRDGVLEELTPEVIERARRAKRIEEGQAKTYEDLLALQHKRGYSSGWAHFKWKARQKRKG